MRQTLKQLRPNFAVTACVCALFATLSLGACTGDPENNDPLLGEADGLGGDGQIVDLEVGQIDAGPLDTSTDCDPPCLAGYVCRSVGAGPVCVVDAALACKPCATATGCLGGACEAVDGEGPFCLIPCLVGPAGSSCPQGYLCEALVGDDTKRYCQPESKSCSCTPPDVGTVRACDLADEQCDGAKTCTDSGWGACSPTTTQAELCDGLDNNCDGATDEGLDDGAQCSVSNEFGICPGKRTCLGAQGELCEGPEAKAETCDGEDNDCDGFVDEPWLLGDVYTADEHCGACGNNCNTAYPNGKGACNPAGKPPHCIIASCDAGYVLGKGECVEKAKIGCPGGDCTCKQADTGNTRPCAQKNAAGTCQGFEVCDPQNPGGDGSGWNSCTAKKPKAEVCNGVDDDCDGEIDEGLDVGGSCNKVNAFGTCQGTLACKGSAGWLCDGPTATAEVCDGADNDCDGDVDETWRNDAGIYVSMPHCDACNKPCEPVLTPNVVSACVAAADAGKCQHSCKTGFFDANKSLVDGCECKFVSDVDEPGGGDANCDGVDGDASKAWFVAKHGSNDNPGTPAKPFATIAWAFQKSTNARRDIYVAGGNYVGNLVLGGVRVYGGYSKDFAVRDPKSHESSIEGVKLATGDVIAVRLICSLSSKGPDVLLSGMTVKGADGAGAGASSIAVLVDGCGAQATVQGCRVVAGYGAKGQKGVDGVNGLHGTSGKSGKNAKDVGTKNCSGVHYNNGGAPGSRKCGGADVSGGVGGTAVCPDYNSKTKPPACSLTATWFQNQQPVEHGVAGHGVSSGAGGLAGFDGYIDPNNGSVTQCKDPGHSCQRCESGLHKIAGNNGFAGFAGGHGNGGQGCSDAGAMVGGKWIGGVGATGKSGNHGSGGGGGGASGGVEVVGCQQAAGFSDIGGSGGGGGSGGCGGIAGTGGGSGGASVGIYISDLGSGEPKLIGNELYGGKGGDGGDGGAGGYGGFGAIGGPGGNPGAGNNKTFCAYGGGKGGAGGAGGHGGGGGGGCGGPAFLIGGKAMSGATKAKYAATNTDKGVGFGGAQGKGGASPLNKGGNGSKGTASFVRSL